MRTPWLRRVILPVGLAILALGAVGPREVAARHLGKGIPDETTVSVSFVASAHAKLPDRIAARLTAYDGTPIGLAEVEFRREIEFLGRRLVLLGRAVTDATGTAQVPISAAYESLRIEARFAGDEQYAASSVTTDISVPDGSGRTPVLEPLFAPPRPDVSLGPLDTVMPALVSAAVVTVWVALALLTATTLRAIERGRNTGVPRRDGGD